MTTTYSTHKRSKAGRALTIERRSIRAAKYGQASA